MSETSLILGLPYIQAAQAQKHVTHNEALRSLDMLVQLTVQSDAQTTAPATPIAGDLHIVAQGATGDWQGQDGALALYEPGGWYFETPRTGTRAWVATRQDLAVFDGASWQFPLHDLDQVDRFALGGLTASAATPFAVRAPNALWDAVPTGQGGSGSVIQSLNREGTTTDAGFALQTDYSTGALFGFFGGDQLRLSTSADGTTFADAFAIDPATGIAAQPARPRFKGVTNFDNFLTRDVWSTIGINLLDTNPQGAFDAGTNLFTAPVAGSYLFGATVIFKRDNSNNVRIGARLVKNGTDVIPGSHIQNTASQANERSGSVISVMAELAAGDTVALEATSRQAASYAMANQTAFWGALLP